ncbi:MAG: hypothetical protein WDW36_007402 [Sanguina aurantia]
MVDAVSATSALHRILLTWDYFELGERVANGGGAFETLKPVPPSFENIKEYKSTFEALLLEECAAQILRGVEEGEILLPHPAVASMHEMKDDFLSVRLALKPGDSDTFSDHDLVLLCKDHPESETCRPELHALGFCEAHEGEQSLRIKFSLTDESQAGNARGTTRARLVRGGLESKGSCWWLLKLANMSTITREWIALQHAHLVPFLSVLLTGQPTTAPESKHLDIPPGMRTMMEKECNTSQMGALQAGLDGTPVVLIQGPPGTGKTRTILNLLSVIMHSAHKGSLEVKARSSTTAATAAAAASSAATASVKSPPDASVSEAVTDASNGSSNGASDGASTQLAVVDRVALARDALWMQQCPWLQGAPNLRDLVPYNAKASASDCFGMARRRPAHVIGRHAGPRAHVLVCAPSNSALDEIVIRILKSGLMDASGAMFAPSIVRIGVRPHHSVASVSIDAIIDSRTASSAPGKTLTGLERDKQRVAVVDEANIVCSTLSFAGSSVFYRLSRKFDVVVIDEAAQAVEPSVLVPLVMGCKQAYLVGDPVQLPATVISSRAVEHNYDMSLFKRLQLAGHPVRVLNTQYRMHPAISSFPSSEFYQGQLLDGEGVEKETKSEWHNQPCFGPFAFYDVNGKENVPKGGGSAENKSEVSMVLSIYRELTAAHPHLRRSPCVAVISPYKAQVKLLKEKFKAALGEEIAKNVDINTIDGFQGREKDVVMFSCVRTVQKGKKRSIGFVADVRRINVGITRARCSLIVVGSARALQVDGHWANLIHSAMERGCFFRTKTPFDKWFARVLAGLEGPLVPSAQDLAVLSKVRARLAAAKSNAGLASENLEVIPGLDDEMEEPREEADEEEDEADDEESREARFAAMEKEMDDLQHMQTNPAAAGTGPEQEAQQHKKARTAA